ncbi:Gag-Pol polyprotein [Stylophora pistillata]|uniref:Gag-Pol polyprotein n=1 Tax=Stylophora pistillata TaxID=50429 RepID=A0A2B4RRT1_STYPI|nr:Gag-Pol polyprotein [Stylophora pistillata]
MADSKELFIFGDDFDATLDILEEEELDEYFTEAADDDGLVSFPSEPSPFEGVRVDDDDDLIDKAFISSVHASHTFVIPPQSEILISGELEDSSNKYGIDGMIVPKPDLSHRYSIFGASELVSVAEDDTIPISKYRDVFAFSDAELGRTSLVQHVIDTSDTTPIKQMRFRTSPEGKQEIDRQVKVMLERGIVQESDASGRLARWALLLQQYDFEIVHRLGKMHGNVDSLSRLPYDTREWETLNQTFYPRELTFTPTEKGIIETELKKLMDKKVIMESQDCQDGHFLTTIKLVTKGCFMAMVDLKDAYYSVPIAPEYQKYLKFRFNGKLYQYTCLPIGLACAPRLFTKLLKPAYEHLRQKGMISSAYIDDSYLQGDTFEDCKKNVDLTVGPLKAWFYN